jgi:biopolymer transport protein ExbB/TolQ
MAPFVNVDLLVAVSIIMIALTIFSLLRLVFAEIRLRLIKEEDKRYYWTKQTLWRFRSGR